MCVTLLVLAGCGGSAGGRGPGASAAPSEASAEGGSPEVSATPTSSASAATTSRAPANGRADLVLTGALAQRLTGAPAVCAYYYRAQKRGVAYTVETDTYSLQVSDSEGDGRTVALLNVTSPQGASYTNRPGTPGTLVAELDRSGARLDLDVRKVLSPDTVHISGTITCSQ